MSFKRPDHLQPVAVRRHVAQKVLSLLAENVALGFEIEVILPQQLLHRAAAERAHVEAVLLAEHRERVSEADITATLYTAASPELDMIVRTGGDLRISNFLLWQAAYAELYFTDVLWPDFDEKELNKAILEFSTRKRRFGGVDSKGK